MMWFWGSMGSIVVAGIGVDVIKNPQSLHNLALRVGDGCRHLWFWPGRVRDVSAYHGRHRQGDPLPGFMWSWQPPRSWSVLRGTKV